MLDAINCGGGLSCYVYNLKVFLMRAPHSTLHDDIASHYHDLEDHYHDDVEGQIGSSAGDDVAHALR